MKQQIKLQDTLLNEVRKKKIQVTIYLVNGFQLTGTVIGFDNFTIIINVNEKEQMVYKHAISTIIPDERIKDILK